MTFRELILLPAICLAVGCANQGFKGGSRGVNGGGNGQVGAQGGTGDQIPADTSTAPSPGDRGVQYDPQQAAGTSEPPRQQLPQNSSGSTHKSSGGSNILPWIIGGVAAVAVVGALAGGSGCEDSAVTVPKDGDPPNPQHLSPFVLADAAYRGGICWGGYDRFCTSYHGPGGGTANLIECAIRIGKVDRTLANCGYRNDVDTQLQSVCRR